MSKADELRKKMHTSTAPAFSPRPSVEVRPLPKTTDEPTSTPKASLKKEVMATESIKEVIDKSDEIINYATYITRKQKKQIKLRAIETGVNDLDIVQSALDEYFKNHPL